MRSARTWLAGVAVVAAAHAAPGVVFYSTGDTSFHTTAPTGSLAGSGWQWQGTCAQYLGTPIAPSYFITAAHFGPQSTFAFQGTNYPVIASYADTNGAGQIQSDLKIYKVSGTFSTWAPLYTNADELAKGLVVFGRGTDRGAAVVVGVTTQGWRWGSTNLTQRWGTNVVTAFADYSAGGDQKLLRAEFNAGGDEAMLTPFDSGGGVFIYSAGAWRLAAINYTVGPAYFSTNSSGSNSFGAAMFDYGGLYYQSGTHWLFATNEVADKPVSFYSTRISQRAAWINSVIPEPGAVALVGAGVGALLLRRRLRRE